MAGSISRTSVVRILQEGYFAAQIQLGHEMKMAETMIFSAEELGIKVSTIIHDMRICLWRTMTLRVVEKHMQLDFSESNHLVMALAKRLL